MKATGEVMAIDRSFEGALQKAVRSLETNAKDIGWEDPILGVDGPVGSTDSEAERHSLVGARWPHSAGA